MKITRNNLQQAVEEEIIDKEQAENLFRFLQNLPSSGPSFDLTHVLYYMGGLVAIGAMTLFMNLGWESFGGWGIVAISIAYALLGIGLTEKCKEKGYVIPAGICATFVVALTPLATYGFQQAMGWWPDDTVYREYHRYIRYHWLYLELATLVVGAIVVWRYRYPFLLMPIAVTLWYMSMDIATILLGDHPSFEFRGFISIWFGLLLTLLAFWVDIRSRNSGDYAFWLYLFGVLTFWGGLTSQHSDSELSKFFYFCINLLLIGGGVVLVRRVFVIFGALGCSIYIGHLAWEVFKDSWLFPIILTIIGLTIIYMGILWQRNEKKVTAKVHALLPRQIKELLSERAKDL